jgi:hypothetical protein
MFIVEYYQVSRYGGHDGTWEIILFDNGNILFQYQDVHFDYYWGNNGRSATVGIQGDAITGLQYSYNSPTLSDSLAICIAYPGQLPDCAPYLDTPWLSQDPTVSMVAGNDSQSVDIIFDATVPPVAQPGECQTTLVIATNDSNESLVFVPVTMNVVAPSLSENHLFLPLILK